MSESMVERFFGPDRPSRETAREQSPEETDLGKLPAALTPEYFRGLDAIERFYFLVEDIEHLEKPEYTETAASDRLVVKLPPVPLGILYEDINGDAELALWIGRNSRRGVRYLSRRLHVYGNGEPGEQVISGEDEEVEDLFQERYDIQAPGFRLDITHCRSGRMYRRDQYAVDNALNNLAFSIEDYLEINNRQRDKLEPPIVKKRHSTPREDDVISQKVARLLGDDS